MRALAPAKINLHLRVAPRSADGFHPLLSWFTTIGLFDTLTVEPSDSTDISLTCDDDSIPTDNRNLVVRAAGLLRAMARDRGQDASCPLKDALRVHLQKRIPAGAGLGGGSSNAAKMLLLLNRLWELNLPAMRLSELAASLGSDVPFFLTGGSCICSGRGEIVKPTPPPAPKVALLMLPNLHVSTAAVYQEFDRLGSGQHPAGEPDWHAWARRDALALLPELVNDLEPAAFSLCPTLRNLREQAELELGRIVRMSGSGSALFTLFDEASEALKAQERLSQQPVRTVVAPIAAEYADDLGRGA